MFRQTDGLSLIASPTADRVDFPATHEVGDIPLITDPLAVCLAAGTLIATPDGETKVETLSIGDLLLIQDGRKVPVKWIGRQTVHKAFTPLVSFEPVRVSAGALGDGLPHTDLVLTAGHALIIDDFDINAGALVNGTTITFELSEWLPDRVTNYHIETENLYGVEIPIYEMDYSRITAERLVRTIAINRWRRGFSSGI